MFYTTLYKIRQQYIRLSRQRIHSHNLEVPRNGELYRPFSRGKMRLFPFGCRPVFDGLRSLCLSNHQSLVLRIKFPFLCQLPRGFARFPSLTLVISRIVMYPDNLLGPKAYLLCSRIRELYIFEDRVALCRRNTGSRVFWYGIYCLLLRLVECLFCELLNRTKVHLNTPEARPRCACLGYEAATKGQPLYSTTQALPDTMVERTAETRLCLLTS